MKPFSLSPAVLLLAAALAIPSGAAGAPPAQAAAGPILSFRCEPAPGADARGLPARSESISVVFSPAALELRSPVVRILVRASGSGEGIGEYPLLVDSAAGIWLVPLRRPLSGWSPGRYDVLVLDPSGKTLSRDAFDIIP